MNTSRSFRSLVVAAAALLLGACAADPHAGRVELAQRGGAQQCANDGDCRMRLPRPRACPGGGQSVPTACCRMNYCGVCWSDCPASGSRSTDAQDNQGTQDDDTLRTM